VTGNAPAVPRFAKLLRALLQADVARGRSIRDLARVSDLLTATGARTYGTDAACALPVLTYVSDLMRGDGERVRQVASGVVKRDARRGEEFVLVEVDRGTIAFAQRPGTHDVVLTFTVRPGFRRDRKRVDRLALLARRPPPASPPSRSAPQPRRVRVHSGSRGDPPDGDSEDNDPHDARRARPAGAPPEHVVPRCRKAVAA